MDIATFPVYVLAQDWSFSYHDRPLSLQQLEKQDVEEQEYIAWDSKGLGFKVVWISNSAALEIALHSVTFREAILRFIAVYEQTEFWQRYQENLHLGFYCSPSLMRKVLEELGPDESARST